MSITRLSSLLDENAGNTLGRIVRRARDMGDLTQILRDSLPAEMAPHLLAANLRDDGELVLICSSSAWAARLRFESALLLEAARKAGAHAARCTARVGHGGG